MVKIQIELTNPNLHRYSSIWPLQARESLVADAMADGSRRDPCEMMDLKIHQMDISLEIQWPWLPREGLPILVHP
ncbi:hypothetical protein ACOSP7_009759 [Xanthoceras sorbifolium]